MRQLLMLLLCQHTRRVYGCYVIPGVLLSHTHTLKAEGCWVMFLPQFVQDDGHCYWCVVFPCQLCVLKRMQSTSIYHQADRCASFTHSG